jgi:dipeptidase E
LRPFFKNDKGLSELLGRYNKIWLAGGNVFLLRRALRYTGTDKYLGNAARKNEIILGGESAGALVVGPTLKFSEMPSDEDSASYITEGYEAPAIWEGLNLINYVPVPHYKSVGYEAEIDSYIERLDKAMIPHKEMTDDQAIIIHGFEEFLLA